MAGPLRPPNTLPELRPPRFDVDGHRQEGVDEGERVGAPFFGGGRDFGDARHVGRELDDEREPGSPLDRPHEVPGRPGGEGRAGPALPDVGAGDVELEGGDPLPPAEELHDADVLVLRLAADVDDDRGLQPGEPGQDLFGEGLDADPLEADGVDEPARRLHEPRRRIALARAVVEALDDQAAERVEVEEGLELEPVAERAAGGEDRVAELQESQVDGEVGHRALALPDDALPREDRAVLADLDPALAVLPADALDAAPARPDAAAHQGFQGEFGRDSRARRPARRRPSSWRPDRRRTGTPARGARSSLRPATVTRPGKPNEPSSVAQ